jgi:hypothetical protein
MLGVVMLSIIMQRVIMMSVVMLSVVAPYRMRRSSFSSLQKIVKENKKCE